MLKLIIDPGGNVNCVRCGSSDGHVCWMNRRRQWRMMAAMGRSLLRLLPRILVLNAGHAFDFACTIAVKPIRHRAMNGVIRVSALSVGFCFAISQTFDLTAATPAAEPGELHALVAQPVDISSSAYSTADRNADANDPESWIALLHYAKLPLNKVPDGNQPAVKRVLCGLLWEEIRPVQQIELIWAANARRQPRRRTDNHDAHQPRNCDTWWNNTGTLPHTLRPTVSADRRRVSVRSQNRYLRHRRQSRTGKASLELRRANRPRAGAGRMEENGRRNRMGLHCATAVKELQRANRNLRWPRGSLTPVGRRCVDKHRRSTCLAVAWRKHCTPRHRFPSALHGHGEMVKRTTLYKPTGPRVKDDRHALDERRELFVSRRGSRKWTNPAPEYGFFVRRTSTLSSSSAEQKQLHRPIRPTLLPIKANSIAGDTHSLLARRKRSPLVRRQPDGKTGRREGDRVAGQKARHAPWPADRRRRWLAKSDLRASERKSPGGPCSARRRRNCVEHPAWHQERSRILDDWIDRRDWLRAIPWTESTNRLDRIPVCRATWFRWRSDPRGTTIATRPSLNSSFPKLAKRPNLGSDVDVVDSIHANPHRDSLGNADVWHF